MQPLIVVVSGNETGSVFPLSAGQHVIGRDELSDVPLTDESVGLRHCILTIDIQLFETQRAQPDADTLNYYETLNATKRDLLKKAFALADDKPKKAAALLGLNLTHLYRLLKNLNMGHLLSDK